MTEVAAACFSGARAQGWYTAPMFTSIQPSPGFCWPCLFFLSDYAFYLHFLLENARNSSLMAVPQKLKLWHKKKKAFVEVIFKCLFTEKCLFIQKQQQQERCLVKALA